MTKKKQKPNPSTRTNDPNYFPGKPGPAPSGVKRKIQIPFMVTEDEFEFATRLARSVRLTVNEMIRKHIFKDGWKSHLAHLRKIQGGNIR